jgi:hypothetical protein
MFTTNAAARPSECVIGRHYRHIGIPLTKVHYSNLIEHLLDYLEVYLFGLIQNLSPIQPNFAKNRIGVKSSISHVASILLKALI